MKGSKFGCFEPSVSSVHVFPTKCYSGDPSGLGSVAYTLGGQILRIRILASAIADHDRVVEKSLDLELGSPIKNCQKTLPVPPDVLSVIYIYFFK